MTTAMSSRTALVIGATGSIGRPVVDEALRRGHRVRVLVRDAARARRLLPEGVEVVPGDLTRPETLPSAVKGVDAVVLVVDAAGGKAASEAVYYTGTRDLLRAIGRAPVHVALMTAIGVTVRNSGYNRSTEAHDWKRRAERLVRASGQDYTIVRPGWFDCNAAGEQRIAMLQGDTRRSGTPRDGAIARAQIARVLVDSLTSPEASRRTFELVAEQGAEQADLAPLFAALVPDRAGEPDAPLDPDTQPLSHEPARVLADLAALRAG